jgi:hypothetical protein
MIGSAWRSLHSRRATAAADISRTRAERAENRQERPTSLDASSALAGMRLVRIRARRLPAMTRDEFNGRLRRDGGFRVVVRLLSEDEGGRTTPLLGDREYRANWAIGADDPSVQAGAPMLIDADRLSPGGESEASLIRLVPDGWPDVPVGTQLFAFEGRRKVAEAVVTAVLPAES